MSARFFTALLLASALVSPALGAPPAAAPAEDKVLAPFRAFMDALNTGDTKAAVAAYTSDAVIVDEFAPFLWRGNKAFADWHADLIVAEKALGMANLHEAAAAPTQFEIEKDMAYAIIPTHLTFTEKGRHATEDGTYTVTLTLTKAGWRMTSCTWTTKP